MVNADEWMEVAAQNSGITTEELDAHAKAYQEAYEKYEEKKRASTVLFKEAERLEGKLVEAMEQAGKKKYHVEGIGTFSFVDKFVVPTPKSVSDKKALFQYIKDTHGEEFYFQTLGVNHNTLQSLYKADFEAYKDTNPDDAASFHIPGLQAPTNMRSLRLTGDRK